MQLLIATRNAHKLAEFRQILCAPGIELVGADEVPELPADVVEDAPTFEGNALLKARALAQAGHCWTMADDSGLEVDALGGEPGVHSARYAGPGACTSDNNAKLLRALQGVTNRKARFRCVLALCAPDGRAWTVDGQCEGRILEHPRGDRGFGYDPLFIPDGQERTFAELPAETKNKLSHRGQALRKAMRDWGALLLETSSSTLS